ncbi:cupin-like domain-containing protein [Xylariales sp. PMI_506]|nr:cupin-like domain-containing protein [Xylariales sp. PMI_506]
MVSCLFNRVLIATGSSAGTTCTARLQKHVPPLHRIHFRHICSVTAFAKGIDIEDFRRNALIAESPILIRQAPATRNIPAITKWFVQNANSSKASFGASLSRHSSVIFPYELYVDSTSSTTENLTRFHEWLLYIQAHQKATEQMSEIIKVLRKSASKPSGPSAFLQFDAPLALLEHAVQFNDLQSTGANRVRQLYIAQSSLNHLPEELKDEIPTPDLVKKAGKGDIYDSSIWLGLEPTYTPLHRDPNPNLFLQMLSSKTIRLLPPKLGQQAYEQVQYQLGSRGNSRFRGTEMMEGQERSALYEAIWGSKAFSEITEATVQAGDFLFIPKGWWHSVHSGFDDGRLNASANWWFR